MYKIGLAETFHGFQKRIFMAIQMAVVMFLAVGCISIYLFQMREYEPFKKVIQGKGVYMHLNGSLTELASEMKSVNQVIYSMADTFEDSSNNRYFTVRANNEYAIKYEPIMAEGRWIKEKESEGEVIEAAIVNNEYGIKTGDIIEVKSLMTEKKVKVKIVGVVAKGALLYDASRVGINDDIYTWYEPMDYESATVLDTYLYVSKSDMKKYGIGSAIQRVIIKFDDNITDEDYKHNLSIIKDAGIVPIGKFDVLRNNTEAIIKGKVMTLFPILLCAFVLVTFGTIALSLLETGTDMNRYSVMYLMGMKWNDCIKIRSIRTIFELIIAFALMWIAKGISNLIYGQSAFLFVWNIKTVITVLGVSVYFYLVAVIPPMIMLRFNSPVALLRKSKV